MKLRPFVLLMLLLPMFGQAQGQERRSDVVVLPQALNDQYKSLKGFLDGSDGQVRKLQQTREEVKKRYPSSHDAPDLELILNELDTQEQVLEGKRKDWKLEMDKAEGKIREVILGAHSKSVEWRAYNPNPVDKLGTVITTTYSLKGDHIVTADVYDQLAVTAQQ
jgi:hypothetical protein